MRLNGIQGRFPGLRARDFGAILIDPPWPYDTYSAKGEGRSATTTGEFAEERSPTFCSRKQATDEAAT